MNTWMKVAKEMLKAEGVKLFAVEVTEWTDTGGDRMDYNITVFHPDYMPGEKQGPTCQGFRGPDETAVLNKALEHVRNGYKEVENG